MKTIDNFSLIRWRSETQIPDTMTILAYVMVRQELGKKKFSRSRQMFKLRGTGSFVFQEGLLSGTTIICLHRR